MMWKLVSIVLIVLFSGFLGGCRLEKQPVPIKETETEVVRDSPIQNPIHSNKKETETGVGNSLSPTNKIKDNRILIKKEFSEEQKKLIKQLDISSDLENPEEVFSIYFSIVEEIEKNSTKVDDDAN